MGHVPDSLPVTDETRERLREQANQLPAPTVLRLCDLLAVAVEDSRQGADPRLPLELALVKVTSPGSDLSRESLAFRVEQLEQRLTGGAVRPRTAPSPAAEAERPTPVAPQPAPAAAAPVEAPPLGLDQLQDAWLRTVLPAVQSRSIPVASLLGEARPATLEGEMLTLEFPASADFHRRQAEEPKNVNVIREALYEVTGHRLGVTLALGEARGRDRGGGRRPHRGGAHLDVQGHLRRHGSGGHAAMSKLDMNKLMQQAQQMQSQMQQLQEEVANEVVEASAGGGMVTVKATGGGEIVGITIDPKAIDPDDPEMLADLVLAAVNEALRSASALMESKMQGMLPGGLGGLGLPGL